MKTSVTAVRWWTGDRIALHMLGSPMPNPSIDSAKIIALDLPLPPSTNRIWRFLRQGHVYKSKEYVQWQKEADALVLVNKQYPKVKIDGPFSISIYLAQHRGDGDNRIKAVLDWLQSREIIRNDSDCLEGHWKWVSIGAAPLGCHVVLTPY